VLLVRKLGVPGHEELAMGSIAEGGTVYLNDALIRDLGIPPGAIAQVTSAEQGELRRREELYRHGRRPVDVRDRRVIVVDDGLATGATMVAAVQTLRSRGPRAIVVATPVASRQACELLQPWVDACIAVAIPEPFHGVGAWYTDFRQTSDAEVGDALAAARGAA
jgi:putative phosphoribosyl transferase